MMSTAQRQQRHQCSHQTTSNRLATAQISCRKPDGLRHSERSRSETQMSYNNAPQRQRWPPQTAYQPQKLVGANPDRNREWDQPDRDPNRQQRDHHVGARQVCEPLSHQKAHYQNTAWCRASQGGPWRPRENRAVRITNIPL